MNSTALAFFTVAISLLMAGCASSGAPSSRGYEIRIRYAEVDDIERVKLPTNAPAGAVVGGFTGLVLSRNSSGSKQVASGIGGAVLGGLATAALEGDRLGYSYRLHFMNGETSNFITEKGYLQKGDCVAVERGNYANIRRVAPVLCTSNPATAADQKYLREAEQCHEAKDQLLAATTEDEINVASRKVSIICEY
jgi:hypothetical protein